MTVPTAPTRARPVQERSPLPDVLRGLSLLGILYVNMQDFAGFYEWQQTGLDGVAQTLTDVFANGRFISIFAMLFGWGAAGILARHGTGVLLKRHALLLLIGTLHFVLVWHGDIIENYALLGLLLLPFVWLGARGLVGVAVLSGGWWLLSTLGTALHYFRLETLPRYEGLPDVGSYAAMVSDRAHEFLPDLLGGSVYNGPWLLALFCLGAAMQRSDLLTRPHEHVATLQKLARWGTALGLALGLALAYLNTRPDAASGLLAIPVRMGGGLAGGLGYIGLLGLLSVSGKLGWLRHFGNSGRIAMSNYLAQSLVMTTIFYPYGLSQWGRWGAAPALALALTFGALQVWLSGFIVRRYGRGPMEKLLRWAVYGQAGR